MIISTANMTMEDVERFRQLGWDVEIDADNEQANVTKRVEDVQ